MQEKCKAQVSDKIGREFDDLEAQRVERDINDAMKRMAKVDPNWVNLSEAERLRIGAKLAAETYIARARLEQQRVELKIAAHDRVENYLKLFDDPVDKLNALSNLIAFNPKGGKVISVESWAHSIENKAVADMRHVFEATNPKFFGLMEDKDGVRDLVREMYGQDTGNSVAKAAAKTWLETSDGLRTRQNKAGGKILELFDWAHPQSHSQKRIAVAGFEQWASHLLNGLLDRTKYKNADGSFMDDQQMGNFLNGVYKVIITDGAINLRPEDPGYLNVVADRGAQHRSLFFKGADEWMKYNSQYGEKTIWDIMTGHIRGMSRDIALLEKLGPDPEGLWNYFVKRSFRDASVDAAESGKYGLQKLEARVTWLNDLYRYVANPEVQYVNQRLADTMQHIRNIMTSAKLGAVVFTSFTDEATVLATAYGNKIGYFDTLKNQAKFLTNAEYKRHLERAGLGLNAVNTGLIRYGNESLGSSWSSKMANWTQHASGAEAMWNARRAGLGSVLMSAIGHLTAKHDSISKLDQEDIGFLAQKGIDDKIWQVWRAAKPEDWGAGGERMVTPNSVMSIPDEAIKHLGDPERLRMDASTALLAHALEEGSVSVMEVGARERLTMGANEPRGTIKGEILRSFWQFKSYPLGMFTRHWARAATMPTTSGKAIYAASLIAGTVMLTAIADQIKNLIAGKDPEDMLGSQALTKDVLKGGWMGLYGDVLDNLVNRHGEITDLFGPAFDLAANTGKHLSDLGTELKTGKGHVGADILHELRSDLPGPFNLWYTKAAFDHLIFNNLQDWLSPGYLDRVQERAAKRGVTHWWGPKDNFSLTQPAEVLPKRAPDASKALPEMQ